jgi:hypothetical protein
MVRQLRQILIQIENPQRPTRLAVFADVASLPPASQWENTLVRVKDVGGGTQGLAYSDGTNWRRTDTNATL